MSRFFDRLRSRRDAARRADAIERALRHGLPHQQQRQPEQDEPVRHG